MSYIGKMHSEYNAGEDVSVMRMASDAYLVIDSADRGTSSSAIPGGGYTLPQTQPYNDFRLQKPQNLLQGGFTGLSLTEVRFPYAIPNVIRGVNNTLWVVLKNPYDLAHSKAQIDLLGIAKSGWFSRESLATVLAAKLNADPNVGTASPNAITWAVGPNISGFQGYGLAVVPTQSAGTVPVIFAFYPVDPQYLTANSTTGIVSASSVPIPNKSLMTIMGFDYVTAFDYFCSFGVSLYSDYAPMTYTTYIDICSDKLTQYQAVKDASSKTNSRNNVICRLFITDETSTTPTIGSFWNGTAEIDYNTSLRPGSTPFTIHRQFHCPKHFRWNKEVAVDWIDIKLYDDVGNSLFVPDYSLPDFQLTFKASED
jgi:hypothetical protein